MAVTETSESKRRPRVAIIGPVFPYRAGIAYCTTRLAEELEKSFDVTILSFKRQYPRLFYPGSTDIDDTLIPLVPPGARFSLDIVNPITWIRAAWTLWRARVDAVIFVWWIWVWAIPYRLLMTLVRPRCVILQCHNIGEKETAWWKRKLSNLVLRRGDVLIVHAKSEEEEARRRLKSLERIHRTFLPVHELGGAIPTKGDARAHLHLTGNVALFFGHVRPFKALDVALEAMARVRNKVTLLVAGEAWWKGETEYRRLARSLKLGDRVRFDFRFIPDAEIATYFAAADVVLAPYRTEAQSGVALTAFHFGRPVIASTVGGLPEIIEEGKNGLLVPPENPDALALAIDKFFDDPSREQMAAGARESAQRYSWEEYGRVFARYVENASQKRTGLA